jgi:hypothetical protein
MGRKWLWVSTGLAAVVMAGCVAGPDGNGGDDGKEPTIPANPAAVDPANLVLPLDEFRQTRQQDATMQRAIGLLTQDCMKRFGFEYPLSVVNEEKLVRGVGRRYFLVDSASAATFGYHPDPKL